MNKRQRKKRLQKMNLLIRLANRSNSSASKKKPITDDNLNESEVKFLPKSNGRLIHDNSPEPNKMQSETVSGAERSNKSSLRSNKPSDSHLEVDFINKKLPKELIIRIFSYLDINSMCRCACVSKYWNVLALDGSNWQYVDLFNFQTDVSGYVVENLAKRCREFLKAIRLENCRWINDNSIKLLFNACRNIEILNLRQCIKLTDNAFIDLRSNLSQLKNVNLESCFVGDGGVEAIARGCPNLESIDLSWCKNVTRFALEKLAGSCPKLKYFSSRGLASMSNEVLTKISENCLSLTHLNINNCTSVSDSGIHSIASECKSLKFLSVSNCLLISNASLISLGQNCPDLLILEASCCSNLGDTGFVSIAKGCQKLERIDIEECVRITDLTVMNLANGCSQLRHLTLSRCECITDEAIRQLSASNCASVNETLQVLELDNCNLITDNSLESLYPCKSLIQLELYDCQLISRGGIKKLQKVLPNCKVHAYFAPSIAASSQRPSRSCSCKCCTVL